MSLGDEEGEGSLVYEMENNGFKKSSILFYILHTIILFYI